MNRCLKISFSGNIPDHFIDEVVQKTAQKLNIEGTVQTIDEHRVNIVACGIRDSLEEFLDALYQAKNRIRLDDMIIEPFLKAKDYRGVFRIIE